MELPRDMPLFSVEVLSMIKRRKVRKGEIKPTEMELTLNKPTSVSYEVLNIRVILFTVKMEILLETTSNKLMVDPHRFEVEYGVSTSIGYGVFSFLSNTAYSSQQINTVYPLSLDTAYRSSGTKANSKRYFKTLSLDELRLPDFNLLFDQEYSKEEEEEEMVETMEQYMSKTRTDYGSESQKELSRKHVSCSDNETEMNTLRKFSKSLTYPCSLTSLRIN
ncbi:hypothetical protein Tco_1437805 [Tanacetum coccineum]